MLLPSKEYPNHPVETNTPQGHSSLQDAINRIADTIDSIASQPEPTDQRKRAEKDLRAQIEMAKWAKIMTGVTVAQVILTVLSLIAIIITLKHTGDQSKSAKRAIESSERTAIKQLRAYVTVTDAIIENTDNEFLPVVQLSIKNAGQTPAYKVHIRFKYAAQQNGTPSLKLGPLRMNRQPDLGPGAELYRNTIIPSFKWAAMNQRISANTHTFVLFGECTYEDAFEKSHTTEFRFHLPVHNGEVKDGGLAISQDGNRSD